MSFCIYFRVQKYHIVCVCYFFVVFSFFHLEKPLFPDGKLVSFHFQSARLAKPSAFGAERFDAINQQNGSGGSLPTKYKRIGRAKRTPKKEPQLYEPMLLPSGLSISASIKHKPETDDHFSFSYSILLVVLVGARTTVTVRITNIYIYVF